MIIVNTVEIFLSDSYVRLELSDGKKYRILLKDYENLPFGCKPDSRLENTIIDTDKISLSETNGYFEGDCAAFLGFLSKKYAIYKSAIAKVALADVPKKQLFQKLFFAVRKNSPEADAGQLKTLCGLVCAEFEARGYVDDRRYAQNKAKYLKDYKKYGNGKIKEQLYQKGIPPDIISETLEDEYFSDEEGEFSNMRTLLRKKYGENLDRMDKSDKNAVQKAITMLVRNGYRYQAAKNALAEIVDETDIDFMEDEEYIDE